MQLLIFSKQVTEAYTRTFSLENRNSICKIKRMVDNMCDLMDCKDCRHLCKNKINDYEAEKL